MFKLKALVAAHIQNDDKIINCTDGQSITFCEQAAIYGMAQSIPDRSIVSEIAGGFFDAYYSTSDGESPK